MSYNLSEKGIRDKIASLINQGKMSEAMDFVSDIQGECTHKWGPWSGAGATRRTCKICGKVEHD
jgi:hypothetical protein